MSSRCLVCGGWHEGACSLPPMEYWYPAAKEPMLVRLAMRFVPGVLQVTIHPGHHILFDEEGTFEAWVTVPVLVLPSHYVQLSPGTVLLGRFLTPERVKDFLDRWRMGLPLR